MVDKWTEEFRLFINDKFKIGIPKHTPINLTTVDVDNVYAFRNKGIIRHILSSVKDLVNGNRQDILKRWKTLFHVEDDPFFNIEEVSQRLADETPDNVIFFHCGCYGKFDKKTIFPSLFMKKIIKGHLKYYAKPQYFLQYVVEFVYILNNVNLSV